MLFLLKLFSIVFIFDIHLLFVHGILGGSEIEMEDAPYHVSYGDICGGVLIHKKWAVTSAHCGNENFIRIGNKKRQAGPRVKIVKHKIHPKFGILHEFDYDIQLLELQRKLRIRSFVAPIEINENINYGDHIGVAGWGRQKEKGEYTEHLMQVDLKLVPIDICQMVKQKWYNNTLTSRMFCAEGAEKDACQGDSGGAAVFNGYLVGLASFGYGCGRNIPGVYINISNPEIRHWIYDHTGV